MTYDIVQCHSRPGAAPFHVAPSHYPEGHVSPIFYSEGVEAPVWGYPDALNGFDIGLLRDPDGFREWAASFTPDMEWCAIKRPASPDESWQIRYHTGFEHYQVTPTAKWKGVRYLDVDVDAPSDLPPEWFNPHHQDIVREAMEAYDLPQLNGVWDRAVSEDHLFRDLLLAFVSEYAAGRGLTIEDPYSPVSD